MNRLDKVNDLLDEKSDEVQKGINKLVTRGLGQGKKSWSQFQKESDRLLGEAKERGGDLYAEARRMVRRNPTKAVSAALATGLLLGAALLASSRSKKKRLF